jgi:hypothetical protein
LGRSKATLFRAPQANVIKLKPQLMDNKVKETLYFETDGGCAICGIRDQRVLTVHHIDHETKKKNNSYDNLIVVCHNCHTSYHQNKGLNKTEIKTIKKRLIKKTLTQFGVNALKEAKRKSNVSGAPFLLNHLVEMSYLKFEEGLMGDPDSFDICVYKITNAGKELLKKWKF